MKTKTGHQNEQGHATEIRCCCEVTLLGWCELEQNKAKWSILLQHSPTERKTHWEYRQTHLLIWRRVIVHEKDSIRMPEINTEILQPYTLDCPSAKSVIKARSRLLLGSLSTMSQEVYSSSVEHSRFFIFIVAMILLSTAWYRSIRITSDSGGKLSPRHCISWISVNPWKDLDDSPIKSERMKLNVILKSNWEILAPKD